MKKEEYQGIVYNVVNRYQSQWSRVKDNDTLLNNPSKFSDRKNNGEADVISKGGGYDDFLPNLKWKPEVAWFSKALEPALQIWRRYLPTGTVYFHISGLVILTVGCVITSYCHVENEF